jgi:RsmE family RNA methyltransferase
MVLHGPRLLQAFHAPTATRQISKSWFHSSTRLYLNRFLFDSFELDHESSPPRVVLPKDDYRTVHAAKILGLSNGDQLRAGVVSCDDHDGLWTDMATVEWIPEGKVKKAEVLGNGNPPGSLSVSLDHLTPPDTESQELLVSLILALPRPLQLARMLPMISQMGVDQLILTGSRKVPKDYFGSHLFRKPEVLRERLIEGLCQAGDVRLPKVKVVKNLRTFLEDEMDTLFPSDTHARVIAHPQRVADTSEPLRMGRIEFPSNLPPRVVIAVGPEGGWEEPGELEQFQKLGFQQITLGTRTLRSDCAVVSLISLAQEVCQERR